MRVILHIDLDYFFAQIEERLNPELKNKPLVVCVYSGRTDDSGAVSTSNYLAREYGVKSGIPIYLAKKILKNKDAVFVPVNHKLYDEVSQRIMNLLRTYSDRFEQVSIDEAFLDVTLRVNGNFERAHSLAQSIKKDLLKKEGLTCSIGIGQNKLVAKIASSYEKPDGLTQVSPSETIKFLHVLPVDRIPGVGKKSKEILKHESAGTIGELASLDISRLKSIFGNKVGEYFKRSSMGIDDEPVKEEEPKQFSRIMTLKEDSIDFDIISPIIKELCEEVSLTIKNEGFVFRSVGLIVIMDNLKMHSKSKTLNHYSNDAETIFNSVSKLMKVMLNQTKDHKVRRIGVKVYNLDKIQNQKILNGFI